VRGVVGARFARQMYASRPTRARRRAAAAQAPRQAIMRTFILIGLLTLNSVSALCANQMHAVDFFGPGALTSLAEAAAAGQTNKLDMLVASGADINAKGVNGMTALYWAMAHSSKNGVSWLLDHGANPNIIFARDGTSATSLAAMQEDPWFLKEVLTHGGDVNVRNPLNEHTPIFDALAAHRDDNVRALIAAGADINTYDHLGLTPLVEAAVNQRYELVYEMLNAGADPAMTVPKGKGNKTILSVVRRSRVPPDAPPYQWQLKVVDLLKQRGLDVEHGD
jgi:hypothetical protein